MSGEKQAMEQPPKPPAKKPLFGYVLIAIICIGAVAVVIGAITDKDRSGAKQIEAAAAQRRSAEIERTAKIDESAKIFEQLLNGKNARGKCYGESDGIHCAIEYEIGTSELVARAGSKNLMNDIAQRGMSVSLFLDVKIGQQNICSWEYDSLARSVKMR